MKNILKLTLSLGIICLVAGILLTNAKKMTEKSVAKAEAQSLLDKMALVLPEGVSNTLLAYQENDVDFYAATDERGDLLAWAAVGRSMIGFKGEVEVLVGFNMDGTIRGVLVTKDSETPGIGSRVTKRVQKKSLWSVLSGTAEEVACPPNAYLDSFAGHNVAKPIELNGSDPNDVKGISGATISSRAVLAAVNSIGEAHRVLEVNGKLSGEYSRKDKEK